jgi:hypothetical protein
VPQGIGAGFHDIVELTTYLVGEARNAVHAEHFGDGPYPRNMLRIISCLVRPEMRVEVSAIVRLPERDRRRPSAARSTDHPNDDPANRRGGGWRFGAALSITAASRGTGERRWTSG